MLEHVAGYLPVVPGRRDGVSGFLDEIMDGVAELVEEDLDVAVLEEAGSVWGWWGVAADQGAGGVMLCAVCLLEGLGSIVSEIQESKGHKE